jgi:2-polyprenyl-3-methyl-5-hydroxy-6-metoxy-1,4-benzoquinol methylase
MKDNNFTYEETDLEGLATLQVISANDHFNSWMYDEIKPYIKGNILEIGSGIGNISQWVLKDNHQVTLSDIRQSYCDFLTERFFQNAGVKAILNIDIVHAEFDLVYSNLFNKYDCIFALNTIEHVENDFLAISNCLKLLKPNGHLIILAPAYNALYNRFDKELKHYRRYTKKTLEQIFSKEHTTIVNTWYFNFIGILGWWISGSILKNKTIPNIQMRFFNSMVPFFKLADYAVMKKCGLSVITVALKKQAVII